MTSLSAEEPTALTAKTGEPIATVLELQPDERLVAIGGGLAIPVPANRTWQQPGRFMVCIVATDGGHRWQLVDVAGEGLDAETHSESAALLVDLSPPQAKFVISGPRVHGLQGPQLAPSSVITATFDDPSGVVESQLRDATRQVPAAQGLTEFSKSTGQVIAWAVDGAGNAGPAGTFEFAVDADGPIIKWAILDEGAPVEEGRRVYQSPVRVTVSAVDAVAGVSSLQALGSDFVQDLENGAVIETHAAAMDLLAVDGLGNQTRTRAAWKYDRDGPRIQFLVGDELQAERRLIRLPTGGRLSIDVNDDGAGVETAQYRTNRRNWRSIPGSIQFVDRGSYRLEVRASDRFGNISLAHRIVKTSGLPNPERGSER